MYYLGYHRVLHKTTNHYYNLLFDRVDLIPDGTIFTKAKLVELDLPIDISDKQIYSRYYWYKNYRVKTISWICPNF